MADRFNTTYRIGGTITAKQEEQLEELLEKNDVDDHNVLLENGPLIAEFYDLECGQAEDLEEWLRENRLPYLVAVEGKYEFSASLSWWTPEGGEGGCPSNQQGHPLVEMSRVEDWLDGLPDDSVVRGPVLEKRIRDFLAANVPPDIPAFVVVGAAAAD